MDKAIIKKIFEEVLNNNNLSAADEILHPEYTNYSIPVHEKGPEGFKQVIGMFRNAFPDMHITLEDIITEGDKIATRGYWTGTHKGDFMGIPATGKSVKVPYIDIWNAENGKLKENWVQMDMISCMQQLGVMPKQN